MDQAELSTGSGQPAASFTEGATSQKKPEACGTKLLVATAEEADAQSDGNQLVRYLNHAVVQEYGYCHCIAACSA